MTRDFNEARKFARQLNLTSHKEWVKYCKSGYKPLDISYNPDREYKHKGWMSWGDWLGTGNLASKNKKYLPFKEAREIIRSLNLKTTKEFQAYQKSDNRHSDIPCAPWRSSKCDRQQNQRTEMAGEYNYEARNRRLRLW
jgi:hypothetical protein